MNVLHFTPLFVFISSRYHIIFSLFCYLISFYFYGANVNVNVIVNLSRVKCAVSGSCIIGDWTTQHFGNLIDFANTSAFDSRRIPFWITVGHNPSGHYPLVKPRTLSPSNTALTLISWTGLSKICLSETWSERIISVHHLSTDMFTTRATLYLIRVTMAKNWRPAIATIY